MASSGALKIIAIVIFLAGIICAGIFVYYILWANWETGWDHTYTWLLIIGLALIAVGTILVNKYLK